MAVGERLQAGLAGRYRIEQELGRGGTATVYLAHDLKHDRPVALKALHPQLAAVLGPERFLREIRVAARLQHPHILPIHDSGEAAADGGGPGLLWYTMPHVEGESLRDRLRREVQLGIDDAAAIAREVAEALAYAHEKGILHRDIKPENILLSRGHAVVADFGIALAATDDSTLTATGLVVGTPAYMSPEQASGERRLDGRSDIYAVGCVLYEMLAGEPPFSAPTAQGVMARRLTEPVPAVRLLRPGVPPALERAVERALAPVPADRFPDAAAFALALAARGGGSEGGAAERSIAVLPFVNLSADPENEFFADGMTDELINALAKVSGLHVVSRTSAFAFKGRQEDIRGIGERLRVRSVLEGSVRRAGRRLRVAAQLTSVADGFLLWSESYDREAEDVFAIQDEISRAIAGALRVKLLGTQQAALVRPPTEDLEAYGLYLKGRHFWNRRTEQSLRRGLDYFQQALARDARYALAHAGVADSYAILGFYSSLPPGEAFPAAKAAALRALEIDPALAEAHPSLAYVAMYYEWDWATAEAEFQRAIALNPGYATAHQWYGNFLSVVGRHSEAVASFARAEALDPLSPLKVAAFGWGYYFARRYPEAVAQCRRAVELDPGYGLSHMWLGLALLEEGQREEAVAELEEAARSSGRTVASLGFLAHALAVTGRADEARRLQEALSAPAPGRFVSPYDLGLIHLGLGQPDLALARLEEAYAVRDHQMVFLRVDPRLDPLRGTDRLHRLLQRMRFP